MERVQSQSEIESDVWNLSEWIRVFEELDEEEVVGKMYAPDARDAENVVPEHPDVEWRHYPSGLEEW